MMWKLYAVYAKKQRIMSLKITSVQLFCLDE